MKESNPEYLKQWLIKANEDIAVIIELSSEHPENYCSAISFHSQQAIEKFLKAFLVFHKKEFERTHDVDFLLAECMSIDKSDFEELDLKDISDYAVTVRYPDDFLIPTVPDAITHKEIAMLVKEIVERKISGFSQK